MRALVIYEWSDARVDKAGPLADGELDRARGRRLAALADKHAHRR